MKEFIISLLTVVIMMGIFFGWVAGIGALLCAIIPEFVAYVLAIVSFFLTLIVIISIATKRPIIDLLDEITKA